MNKSTMLVPAVRALAFLALTFLYDFLPAKMYAVQEGDKSRNSLEREFLQTYWARGSENESRARDLYERAESKGLNSDRSLEAFVWNRLNQARYAESEDYLKQITARNPDRVEFWIALSWVQVILDHYDASMTSLTNVRSSIEKLALDDPLRDLALGHVGRMLAFVEGPRKGKVNDEVLRFTLAKLMNGLSDADAKVLEDAKKELLAKFEGLSGDQAAAMGEFMDRARRRAEAEANAIDLQMQQNQQRLEQLSPESSRVADQFRSQSNNLQAQIAPLQSTVNGIQSDMNAINNTLQATYADIFFQQQLLAQTRDPNLRFYYRNLINQLALQARNLELQLGSARSQLVAANSQLNGLGNQLGAINSSYQNELARIRNEEKSLQNANQKLLNKLTKLADGPPKVTGEASRLEDKLTQLSAYYRLPLELFRQEALDRMVE